MPVSESLFRSRRLRMKHQPATTVARRLGRSRHRMFSEAAFNPVLRKMKLKIVPEITEYRSNCKTIKSKHDSDKDYIPDLYSAASDSNYDSSSSDIDIRTTEVVHGNDSGCIVQEILLNMIEQAVMISKKEYMQSYTKKRDPRKRKLYETSLAERKKLKQTQKRDKHPVQLSCDNCRFKCTTEISCERHEKINNNFWKLQDKTQRQFIFSATKKINIKRKTTGSNSSRRNNTILCLLKNENGLDVKVYKKFFLANLGYTLKNDRRLRNIITMNDPADLQPRPVKLGHPSSKRIDRDIIIEHINSFYPQISHYRREHAPLRKYLPSDVNITLMDKDFVGRYSDVSIFYELLYWDMKNVGHARPLICTANLLVTIIMLPRCEMLKELIFTSRLTAFTETFVPIGKQTKAHKPFTCIWYERTAGRRKEDIISAFYSFFGHYRDVRAITICEQKEVNFLAAKYYKDGFTISTCRTTPRGVSKEKKANLVLKVGRTKKPFEILGRSSNFRKSCRVR
ncbi:hypothetical protein ILUMI_27389 [Ignelater luminosus]|uniref:Uncharacterized protein n=1 Tax=Ignelater luminosus TaxID=2038154 RepID=A0A8K0FVN5_IGNLU|nr:hypothetical protein ILUMI_27389 [Ignelater luminosus]